MPIPRFRKRKATESPLKATRKRRTPLPTLDSEHFYDPSYSGDEANSHDNSNIIYHSESELDSDLAIPRRAPGPGRHVPSTPNRHPWLGNGAPQSPHKHHPVPSVLCTPASARTLPAWEGSSSPSAPHEDDYEGGDDSNENNAGGPSAAHLSPALPRSARSTRSLRRTQTASPTPTPLSLRHCGMTSSPEQPGHSTPRSPSARLDHLLRALPLSTAEAIAAAVLERDRQAEELERARAQAMARIVGRLEAKNEALERRVEELGVENEGLRGRVESAGGRVVGLRGVLRKFVRRER